MRTTVTKRRPRGVLAPNLRRGHSPLRSELDRRCMSYAPGNQSGFEGAIAAIRTPKMIVHVEHEGATVYVAPVGPSLGQREAQPIMNEVVTALHEMSRGTRLFVVDLSGV